MIRKLQYMAREGNWHGDSIKLKKYMISKQTHMNKCHIKLKDLRL